VSHYFIEDEDNANYLKLALLLSPLPILAIAFLGSNDIFPMVFLILALVSMKKRKGILAGGFLGLAVGSKLILGVAVVALVLYAFRSQNGKTFAAKFICSFVVVSGISLLPMFYSPGFLLAIFSSEDATGPLAWGLSSPYGQILLLPIVVIGAWYATYQLKRMNFKLLLLSVAGPLLIIGSVPGAPLGWTLWALPLVLYLSSGLPTRFKVLSIIATSAPVVVLALSQITETSRFLGESQISSFADTSVVLIAFITFFLLWREHVTRGDFIRLHSKPALILISGDSGVGKDTLAEGLTRALGEGSCVRISGDDYHRWDRNQGAWDYLTHLNPSANDLTRFFNDVLTLSSGGEIKNGHYDHRIGRRLSSRTARSREFVIASGLHSLYVADVNKQALLKIYMEMSDDLRSFFKLNRDTALRGHTPEAVLEAIQSRKPDSNDYIKPQMMNANLVISADFSGNPRSGEPKQLKLDFTSEPKIFDEQLVSELVVTCGLEVSSLSSGQGKRTITVQGKTDPTLIQTAFNRIEPRVSTILPSSQLWSPGSAGILEMIAMVYLSSALRQERLI
jgi:uridine kinase